MSDKYYYTHMERKNELAIVQIQEELKHLAEKLDMIRTNDLIHIQRSIDGINKILWAVGLLLLGQLAFAVQAVLWS
jgi:hypothetical protein